MTIVFVSYHYSADINSPAQWLHRLQYYVGWLERLARQHTIIRVDQINYEGNFTHNGVQYRCIGGSKKKNYFPRKLHALVQQLKPDAVVVGGLHFPLQLIQLRQALGKHAAIIVQHHAEKPFTGIKKYIQQWASRKADIFLFAAAETGLQWVQKGNLHNAKKIRPLMEVSSTFYPLVKQAALTKTTIDSAPVYLWVGRLNANKDPLTAVKAFLKFAVLHPQAKLYMIYQTNDLLVEIQVLLASHPAHNNVALVGQVQHHDLLYWFNSADYYLSASFYEGSGTALCEALSCGCIPIVTNIPSFKTICGNCGLLYEPGNEEMLLTALLQSVTVSPEKEKTKALQQFNANLSFDAIAKKMNAILHELQ
jgi:glycosyltransferase involved in cell wall biosynthesis